MERDTLKKSTFYAVINGSPSSDSAMIADEVGQECCDEVMNSSCDEIFPERVLFNASNEIPRTESLSPKLIPRFPKLRLNFDVPDGSSSKDTNENAQHLDNEINHENRTKYPNVFCHATPSCERLYAMRSNLGEPLKIDIGQPIPFFVGNKLRHNKSAFQTKQFYYTDISRPDKLQSDIDLGVDSPYMFSSSVSPPNITIPDCGNKNFEIDLSMDESSNNLDNSMLNDASSLKLPWWRIPLAKCYEFSNWVSNIIYQLMKTNFHRLSKSFVSTTPDYGTMKCTEETDHNLVRITSIIHAENERILLAFTEKLNDVTQELNKVHRLNETTLSVLRGELDVLKNDTSRIVDTSGTMTKDLMVLSKKLDETIQMNSVIPLRLSGSTPTLQIPPPPPPPPPPLPRFSPTVSLPMTPKSENRNRFSRTPTRKSSTPLTESRPSITVEDILKVKLKKAPQANKENDPKNNSQTPRGPVVSVDMLRSVKLKSTRRNRNNADTKNMRSPHRAMKGRETQSLSLSPIMTGAVSPLSRILKQMDNRRGCNKALMSPTHSENDLTKDNQKQFDVARPTKSSLSILV